MPAAHDQQLVNPAPMGQTQRLANAVILILLLYQMIVPLEYYYRWNFGTDDEADERFSWRFFSSVSLRQCDYSFSDRLEEGLEPEHRPIPLQSIVELGSVKKFVRSNHRKTVEKLLRWRCDHPGVAEVSYSRTGTAPDGSPLDPVHLIIDRRTRTIRAFEPPP